MSHAQYSVIVFSNAPGKIRTYFACDDSWAIPSSSLPSLTPRSQGAEVVECACMIELKALNGVGKLHESHPDVPVWSLISEDILTVNGQDI